MSTRAGDKDHFHDHVAFDGLSPLVNPKVNVIKSVMIKQNYPNQIFQFPLLQIYIPTTQSLGFLLDPPYDFSNLTFLI